MKGEPLWNVTNGLRREDVRGILLAFPVVTAETWIKTESRANWLEREGGKGVYLNAWMFVWKLEEVSKLAKGGQNKKNQEKRFSEKSRCYIGINALSTIRDKLLSNIFKVSLTLNMFHARKFCGPRRRWDMLFSKCSKHVTPDFQNSTMWSNLTDCEQSWEQWKEATEKLKETSQNPCTKMHTLYSTRDLHMLCLTDIYFLW